MQIAMPFFQVQKTEVKQHVEEKREEVVERVRKI
jgi:hypothetical protein